MEDIILLGFGGHAHSVVDSIERTGKYHIIGFLDTKDKVGKKFKDYYVLDTDYALEKIYSNGVKHAFVTIGFMGKGNVRNRLYCQLKEIGYQLPNIVDNSAIVSDYVRLDEGIFVGKKAVINANVHIEKMCIINTGAIIEHDCVVEEYSHISVGSVLCGGASIGSQSFIGANATVIQEISVGNHTIIGAGTVVTKNIEDNIIQYGLNRKIRNTGD